MIKKVYRTVSAITRAPLNQGNKCRAVARFFRWQLSQMLFPAPVVYRFVNNSQLVISKGMTGATRNIYLGLSDYSDMSFMLHFLRQEDLFADIGANVGVYTVLAASAIGCRAVAFEPIDTAYASLSRNVQVNHMSDRVRLVKKGLGSCKTVLRFTADADTVNHVVVGETDSPSVSVEVSTLDEEIGDQIPNLIKIDVEGFESEVFKGGARVLADPALNALIVELNGRGKEYGHSDQEIHQSLVQYGFTPCAYDPRKRQLLQLDGPHSRANTIYVRDLQAAGDRLRSASAFSVCGIEM